jgi:hypothetical protein
MASIEKIYEVGVLDPLEQLGRFFTRIIKDFEFGLETDFSTDIELPIEMINGMLCDISISTDSTDWSACIFSAPNMISGVSPTSLDMQEWGFELVHATDIVGSTYYTYQHTYMAPKVFRHNQQDVNGVVLSSLYLRFFGDSVPTKAKVRLVLAKFNT